MRKLVLMLATIFCGSLLSFGQQYERIQNRWKSTYINLEHGAPSTTTIAPTWQSAMWVVERSGADIKLKNRWKNTYLLADSKGIVSTAELNGKSLKELALFAQAIWQFESVPDTEYYRIKNKQSGGYLHIENGKLECSDIGPGAYSAMWSIIPVE